MIALKSLTWYLVLSFQASALEERLRETEGKLKENQEEAQTNMQQLNDANSQLVSLLDIRVVSYLLTLPF